MVYPLTDYRCSICRFDLYRAEDSQYRGIQGDPKAGVKLYGADAGRESQNCVGRIRIFSSAICRNLKEVRRDDFGRRFIW
jgi:hypothetical protein